jgi:hypothetical protein
MCFWKGRALITMCEYAMVSRWVDGFWTRTIRTALAGQLLYNNNEVTRG